MKYLILLCIFIMGCQNKPDPKFTMDQHIIYKVNSFYKNVCSGKGTIEGLDDTGNIYIYRIYVDEYPCPVYWHIQEKDIKAQ